MNNDDLVLDEDLKAESSPFWGNSNNERVQADFDTDTGTYTNVQHKAPTVTDTFPDR